MKKGKNTRKITLFSAASILIIIFLIKIASFYPLWIEKNYSRGIYPYVSSFYRSLFGKLPVSFGDLLYALTGFFLLFKIIKFVKILFQRKLQGWDYKKSLKRFFFIVSITYIYFNLSWGLNYNRPGIASQLGLSPKVHDKNQLQLVTGILVRKVNESRSKLGGERIVFNPYKEVFAQAQRAYQRAADTFPFLQYKTISIKRSLYGRMGNFLGFLGYYNPFTGEAQVNLTQPPFLIPYVSCHEIAHQLGYASESEANFVGYLAAIHSPNLVFQYSAYFDLFNYANRELYIRDSSAARHNYKLLDTLVKRDEEELREYWRKSDNAIEPLIKIFYDHYLKANQQSNGMKSYNEVVGWLIAYYNKYGKV